MWYRKSVTAPCAVCIGWVFDMQRGVTVAAGIVQIPFTLTLQAEWGHRGGWDCWTGSRDKLAFATV
jgi:hypothetical protein